MSFFNIIKAIVLAVHITKDGSRNKFLENLTAILARQITAQKQAQEERARITPMQAAGEYLKKLKDDGQLPERFLSPEHLKEVFKSKEYTFEMDTAAFVDASFPVFWRIAFSPLGSAPLFNISWI